MTGYPPRPLSAPSLVLSAGRWQDLMLPFVGAAGRSSTFASTSTAFNKAYGVADAPFGANRGTRSGSPILRAKIASATYGSWIQTMSPKNLLRRSHLSVLSPLLCFSTYLKACLLEE
jgi:hypothetical protein